jgi:hypothetical protein
VHVESVQQDPTLSGADAGGLLEDIHAAQAVPLLREDKVVGGFAPTIPNAVADLCRPGGAGDRERRAVPGSRPRPRRGRGDFPMSEAVRRAMLSWKPPAWKPPRIWRMSV